MHTDPAPEGDYTAKITAMLQDMGIGPLSDVSAFNIGVNMAVQASIAHEHGNQPAVIRQYSKLFGVESMIAGQFHARDDLLWLHLRGRMHQISMMLSVPFSRAREPEQVALIEHTVEHQDPLELAAGLASIEAARHQAIR